jgi:parallel beta-helix repeat protein
MFKQLRNIMALSIFLMFILNFTFGVSFIDDVSANSSMLFVGGSGLDNYDTIQEAIDDAFDGDEIFVYTGVYTENILVDKSLKITGENRLSTIIDGEGIGTVFEIVSDDVFISNITFKNSGIDTLNDSNVRAGVYIKSNGCSIIDVMIIDCDVGLILLNSIDIVVENCEFDNNAGGINLFNTTNSILSNCTVKNSYDNWGIQFQISHNNKLSNSNISDNLDYGLLIRQCDNNIIINNVFFENSIAILVANTPIKSEDNQFYSNDFIYNTNITAVDYGKNEIWDDGFNGNYWSDYTGDDANNDGIGDISYPIAGNENTKDNYPMINPINLDSDTPIINKPPKITNENPDNNAISILISTSSLSVYVEDFEMDLFNWTIESSPNVGSNSGVNDVDGIKNCIISNLEYDSTYIWYVNVTDVDGSGVFSRSSFVFSTEKVDDNGDGTPGFGIPIFVLSIFCLYFFINKRGNGKK